MVTARKGPGIRSPVTRDPVFWICIAIVVFGVAANVWLVWSTGGSF